MCECIGCKYISEKIYVHVEQGESNDKNETKKTNEQNACQTERYNFEYRGTYHICVENGGFEAYAHASFLGVFEAYAYASKTPKNSMHMPQKRHKFQYAYASKTPKNSFDIYSLLHLECIQSHSPSSI